MAVHLNELTNQRKEYPNNKIITSILPSVSDISEAMSHSSEMKERTISCLKELEIDSNDKLRKQLLVDAKEGGFLGIGGTRISDGEKEAFAEIASALGTNSNLV